MPSDNLMKIIVAIEDKYSKQAKDIDDKLQKLGNTGSQTNNKIAQSAEKVNQKYVSTNKSIAGVTKAAIDAGNNGAKAFNQWSSSTQKAITNFNRLDKESQDMLKYLSQMSDKGRETFIGMSTKAQEAIAKFDALQNETKSWGNTLDYTRSKMQLMGTNVDSLKGKIQVVGSTIKTQIGNSWDSVKNKVTVFGSYIKTHLSSALQSVHDKIASLGSAFDGLGGIITSVFGAIGVNSVMDMTIGLSMSREKVKSLMEATYGAGVATEDLWNKMDTLTTQGVVSLDELSQAMSVIKMSTGATTEQLTELMPVVNDIGQRAIMMGKSGEEAISLMQAAGKGLNGEFQQLQDNFGITKEKLMDLGWSGAADDVEGYTAALQKYLDQGGNMDGLLDTTSGKLTVLGKNFRIAGRTIGDMFMPYINQVLDALISMSDPETGNGLAQWVIGLMAIGSGFATLAPTITPVLQCLDIFWSKGRALLTFLGLLEAEEGALTISTLANTIATKANEIAQAARGVETATLTAEEVALGAATAGLTTEEIAAAAAHTGSAVAMTAEGGAAVVAAGGTTTLTGAIWGMTAALLSNPITWVIVALVALAVVVYEVGKAFGWWKDVWSMLDAIWAGIQRLWSAFINHPDVQAFINGLVWAWNWLCGAIGNVIQWVESFFDANINGEFDIVRALIDAIGFAWNAITFPIRVVISVVQYLIGVFQQLSGGFDFVGAAIQALTVAFNVLTFPIRVVIGVFQFLWGVFGQVASAIQAMYDQFGIIGAIVGIITSPIQFIINIIRGIVCILLGCSPGIVPALEKVGEVFSEVFNAIASFIGSVISTIVNAIQPLIDIFTQIVEYIVELFMPVWELIAQVLTAIVDTVLQVIGVFQDFLSGQITLPQLLQMVWNTILTTWTSIFTLIFNFLVAWGTQVLNTVVTVASNLVNGFISFISQLPGKVWNWLVQTSNRILTALTQAVNYARNKASEIVNGVISFISQLPGKVFNEFINIGKRMLEAGSQLVEKAKKIGEDIVKGILGAMGIHSPGDIQEAVVNEFETMVDRIKNIKGKAGEYAAQVGQAIVDKFGTPELSLNTDDLMPYEDLDVNPLENLDMGNMDLSGLSEATGMTDNTNTMIGESYTDLAGMMSSTLNNMVLNDQLAYGQIQSNDLSTFNAIKTGLQNSLTFMGNNLKTQLNLMSLTHKSAMDSANNTTKTQLASMLNQTTKVVGEMKSAWSIMASSIISAAARIKNESTSYFNQLASTIGSFYQKLQNPSRWGGSPDEAPRRPIGRPGNNLMSRITTGMANAIRRDTQAPSNVSVRSAKKYVTLSPGILEYLGLNNSDNVSVSDLIRGGLINPLQLAMLPSSGWADTANPNIKHIKNKAREWSMKGPAIMGRINTGLAFKVKEFENGKPSISFASFQRMGEALFSAIPYKFYYDSDWMGSWQAAIQAGACNCWDGAHALLALARTCGFNGSIAHGTWNGYPHVYAIINGKKMDTTGWQQRRDWNGVAAGAPRNPLRFRRTQNMDRTSIIDELLSFFDDDGDKPSSGAGSIANVEEVKLTLEHNVNVNVEGNTEEIDTNALIEELTASVTDRNLIDKIADALIKRDKRIARMGGA